MPPVSVLMKPASGLCNMSCDYCFYHDEMKNRSKESYGFMSEETLRNVIRRTMLAASGSISYAYQGGEPTLRGIDFYKKAIEFQKKYNRNRIQIYNAIQTNGYHVDEEWCRFFAQNHFLVGVSVDGTKITHDAHRHDKKQGPTYDKILHTTKLFDEFKVEYNILTVVNQKVGANIETIYNDYKNRGWNYQQYIPCLESLGEEHRKSPYILSDEEYGIFLIKLFDLWYEDWKRGNQPYIRQFDNYIGILLGYQPEACDQRGVCGIQNVVEADGSVYPCDFYMLDDYYLGNFNDNRLEDMNRKREEIGFVQKSLRLSPKCGECQFKMMCKGGCQRNRINLPGTELYENYFCEGYKMFFETCLGKMQEMVNKLVKEKTHYL